MSEPVFFTPGLETIQLPWEYTAANAISGLLFLIGIVVAGITIQKILGGEETRGSIKLWIGSGFVFLLLHQVAEIKTYSGIHGGFPETLFGELHILLLQPLGGIMYLLSSYLLYKKMKEMKT